MEQYADVVLDLEGNAVQGATVQAFSGPVNASLPKDFNILATIYDVQGTKLESVTTGARGEFAFQVPNGKYVIQVKVRGSIYATIGPRTFYDPDDDGDRVSATDLASANGVRLVGNAVDGRDLTAAKLDYTQQGSGSVPRDIQARLREKVSVMGYGAPANGVDDDSPAFARAARAATSNVLPAIDTLVVRAPVARVHVPAGVYKLNDVVNTSGTDIEWLVDPGARIINIENLLGIVNIGHMRTIRPNAYGTFDTAVAQTIITNGAPDTPPSVLGVTDPAALANYPYTDVVGLFVSNTLTPVLFKLTAPAYTAKSVTCPTPVDVRRLRAGMIIKTAHEPPYVATVTGWAGDGSSIQVSGWYLTSGAATPANGIDAYVSPISKIYGSNMIAVVPSDSYGSQAAVCEFDIVNNKGPSASIFSTAPTSAQTWGSDSVSLGLYPGTAAYTARGTWWNSYVSVSGQGGSVGFQTLGLEDTGFWHRNNRGTAFLSTIGGVPSFSVSYDGRMEVGRQDVAQPVFVDFHSSGTVNDYDARIQCGGGSAQTGEGMLLYVASAHQFNGPMVTGNVFPGTDNTFSYGLPSNRISVVYAASPTINSSDRDIKDSIQDIDAAVLRAAGRIQWRQFKFKDAVEKKGEDARWHMGVIAQEVQEAFEAEGLDAFQYGLLCYDEWPEEWVDHPAEFTESPIADVDGAPIRTEIKPAWREKIREKGGRYGVRYEELMSLFCAYLSSRLI